MIELVGNQKLVIFQLGDFALKGGDGFGVGGFDHTVNQGVLLFVERVKLAFIGCLYIPRLSCALIDRVFQHICCERDHVFRWRHATQDRLKPTLDFFGADVLAIFGTLAVIAKEVRIVFATLAA